MPGPYPNGNDVHSEPAFNAGSDQGAGEETAEGQRRRFTWGHTRQELANRRPMPGYQGRHKKSCLAAHAEKIELNITSLAAQESFMPFATEVPQVPSAEQCIQVPCKLMDHRHYQPTSCPLD